MAGGDEKQHVAFFALFHDSEKGIAQRLRSLGMRFAYFEYMRGSLFVHGSTLEQTFVMHDQTLMPGIDDSVETDAEFVGHVCNTVLVLLGFMQSELWPKSLPSRSA